MNVTIKYKESIIYICQQSYYALFHIINYVIANNLHLQMRLIINLCVRAPWLANEAAMPGRQRPMGVQKIAQFIASVFRCLPSRLGAQRGKTVAYMRRLCYPSSFVCETSRIRLTISVVNSNRSSQ